MSGPVVIDAFGSALGHAEVNRLAINAASGVAVMYIEVTTLFDAFDVYISGKLGAQEKVCAPVQTPRDKLGRRANLVPNCSRVK